MTVLTVSDKAGESDRESTTATIANVAPDLNASLTYEAVLVNQRHVVGSVIAGQFTDPGFDWPAAGTHESFTEKTIVTPTRDSIRWEVAITSAGNRGAPPSPPDSIMP